MPLTLDEAVKLALDRNLDIAVQRLNPEINDIAVASIQSVYNPALTSTVSQASTNGSPTSQLQLAAGGGGTNTNQTTYNGGIAQSIPRGGGSYQVTLNNGRGTSNSNNALFNPQFAVDVERHLHAAAAAQLPHRLDASAAGGHQAQSRHLGRPAAVDDHQHVVERAQRLLGLRVRRAVGRRRAAVADLANQLVKDNQTRVEVGTMAPIDVVQAQSQAATQQQNLVTAQGAMRTAELALKRLIVAGTQDPNWNVQLDPTDRPDFRAEPIDIEAAVRRALSERTDLEIAKKNIEANDVTLKYPAGPDEAASRPAGDLRPGGHRRHTDSSESRPARRTDFTDDSRRHQRRVQHAVRPTTIRAGPCR